MRNNPVRTAGSVFFLIPLGSLAGMALAMVNFQLNVASSVEPGDLRGYIFWTLAGGAILGGSFACPASVAAYMSASSGKSPGFCAGAAGAALTLCWLLYAAVSASGGTSATWLLPVAAVLTTAAGSWLAWAAVRRSVSRS
ncbi:hypothetical protein ITX31_13100 [Arthrobacter gandavensis]|uniref:hypothetical protein n=1 Tax=Arthrobacter gandavensis TaxID=169960 RepID=UPI00188DEF6D|nr:hypothetical protein [Arthrobacter gandavensis]MBF4995040.1 hypothetical protein [Arthrobacter gandavensis]